jgi:hypothetical protein
MADEHPTLLIEVERTPADDSHQFFELMTELIQGIEATSPDLVAPLIDGKPTPEGAKAIPGLTPTFHEVVVIAGAAQTALLAVLRAISLWKDRHPTRVCRLKLGDDEIELRGVSGAAQQQLLDLFLERHLPPSH